MRMTCAALASVALVVPAALATFNGSVLYDPPKIKVKDFMVHSSAEEVTVRRAGSDFMLVAQPLPLAMDPNSDPGCAGITDGVSCPRAGIERILLFLGTRADSADIHLGASADDVVQVVKGEKGKDDLKGGSGRQKLAGGPGADTLRGGPGADLLIGGPGDDSCRGGRGQDVIRSCE